MKVVMKSLAAGPGGIYQPGQVVDVPDDFAVTWLNAGYAEPVRRRRETATVGPSEQAVLPSPAGLSVTAVPGIGGTRAEALAELGIETVADLAAADAEEIAAALNGVGRKTIKRWQDISQEMMEE